MKYIGLSGLWLIISIWCIASSCQNNNDEEEKMARKYCSSCHLFPPALLLDKKTWIVNVLPAMGTKLGLVPTNFGIKFNGPVTENEWKKIQAYYFKNAPDSLIKVSHQNFKRLENFVPEAIHIPNRTPMITLLYADSIRNVIYAGTRFSVLYTLDSELEVKDSLQFRSPPSDMKITDKPYFLLMGIMDPNDQAVGQLVTKNKKNEIEVLIDSLRRPVYFEQADINADSLLDFIICSFGNNEGDLSIFQKLPSGKFKKRILSNEPGARRVILSDYNSDGTLDILALMTQGDEKVILMKNLGDFRFTTDTLLRFPPVYGSSYFEVHDFNNDGHFDILCSNGDNADLSRIVKPYHGIRLFLNNGHNVFKEEMFFPMSGASQTLTFDFDHDGDLDIAAVGFFAEYGANSDKGFLYLEKTDHGYIPRITPLAQSGRWIVMEGTDLENDGDLDIIMGSLAFPPKVPPDIYKSWIRNKTSVLILRNNRIVD